MENNERNHNQKNTGSIVSHFLGSVETLSDRNLEDRLVILSKRILPLKILFPIFMVAAFAGFLFGVIEWGFLRGFLIAIALLTVCAVLFVRMYLLQIEVKRLVGHNVIREALTEVFELTNYSPVGFIDRRQIEAADLIDYKWNDCSGNDFIHGKYKGVSFMLSDIRLVNQENDADGSQRRSKVFKGQWLIVDMNRHLDAALRLRERKSMGKGKKSDAETGNEEFNKKFRISTTDPQAALQILTPHFTEYIVSMDKQAKSRVFVGFMGDKVHIAFNNRRDLFEVKTRKILGGMSVMQIREQIIQEVRYIADMIDELSQNKYLF